MSIYPATNVANLVTWPKSRQFATKALAEFKDNLRTEATLANAKRFLNEDTLTDSERTQQLVQKLCDAIERSKLKSRLQLLENLGEETQFASMLDVSGQPPRPMSDLVSMTSRTVRSQKSGKSEKIHIPYEIKQENRHVHEAIEDWEHLPAWYLFLVNALPYLMTIMWGLLFLWGGAAVFHAIDKPAQEKPYYIIMLYTFQVSCTIGMGRI